MSFGARALIRLGALEHNLNVIREVAPGARVMGVVKANAYGHGLVTVARHLADVDALAVARLPEALRLRGKGIDKPIVLLAGALTVEELADAVGQGFEIVVHSREQVEMLKRHRGGATVAWLKFDTGMNRLGFLPRDAGRLIDEVGSCPAVSELRLMTHLASADEEESSVTAEQLELFAPIIRDFDGPVSIANSPATFTQRYAIDAIVGEDREVWVRPGLALYGVSPFADRTGADLGLRAVMQFEARLIAKKPLAACGRVGYRGRYVSDRDTTLGIVAAGYGDGYTRHFRDGTPVLLNGRRVPLIGNVSMDMIAVDLGPDAADEVGDTAVLWGDGLPVEEVAPWADAIPYELICGVMNREASKVVC